MTQLSEHLTEKEYTKNNTAIKLGIDNSLTPEHLENAKLWATKIFEPIRLAMGSKPIYLSCGYRGVKVNAATKGASKTSYHCKAMAGDLDDVFGHCTNKQIFDFIRTNLDYTELIWEYGDTNQPDWVHVGYDSKKPKEKETLRCFNKLVNGKQVRTYVNFDLY